MSGCRACWCVLLPWKSHSRKKGGPNGTETYHLLSRGSLPEHDPTLWPSRPGSTRHAELTRPQASQVRCRWHCVGVWNDRCRCSGLGRDAQATFKCGHELTDDGNHGCLLWLYYGLLILSRPVIAWNVAAVLINFLSVGAYSHFVRKEKAESNLR